MSSSSRIAWHSSSFGGGDRGYNALFQNPGNGHHWLKVKLIGDPRTDRPLTKKSALT